MDVLAVEHLTKRFGNTPVLEDLTLSVPEHSVFGFIGRNGAGKTTTMKMIMGFLRPTSGTITVNGRPVVYGNARTNRDIGYLPDVPVFYDYMSPREYLRLCGHVVGLDAPTIHARSDELLELVGLEETADRRIHGFSRGMRQRLGIAQALLNEPRLLICDEPTSALDPIGRRDILDILEAARDRTTVLFSTHVLSDVERICDTVGVLDQGRIVLDGDLTTILDGHRRDSVLIEFTDPATAQRLATEIGQLPHITDVATNGPRLTVTLTRRDVTSRALLATLARAGAPVLKYEVLEPSLEDVFLEAVR